MKIVKYSIVLLLAVLAFIFACLNARPVIINYYVGEGQLPLSLLLALVFAVGGLFGMLAGSIVWLRLKAANIRLMHKLKIVEQEIANLRVMPLKDPH